MISSLFSAYCSQDLLLKMRLNEYIAFTMPFSCHLSLQQPVTGLNN